MRLSLQIISLASIFVLCLGGSALCADTASAKDAELDAVKKGVTNLISTIKSGKGHVTWETSFEKPGEDSTIESATYDCVFSGKNCKFTADVEWHVKGSDKKNKYRKVLSVYEDIMKYWRKMEGQAGKVDWVKSFPTELAQRTDIDPMRVAFIFLDRLNEAEASNTGGAKCVGKELVDGDECIVVELTTNKSTPSGDESKCTFRVWVNSSKNFNIVKHEMWQKGSLMKELTLMGESTIKLREYGAGLWAPASSKAISYSIDELNNNKVYKRAWTSVKFADDFRLNVPCIKSDFDYSFPSGTEVDDKIMRAQYTVH